MQDLTDIAFSCPNCLLGPAGSLGLNVLISELDIFMEIT
jgi:hypothetical protein